MNLEWVFCPIPNDEDDDDEWEWDDEEEFVEFDREVLADLLRKILEDENEAKH